MKLQPLPRLAALLCAFTGLAPAAQEQILALEEFNKPTETTGLFPPAAGKGMMRFSSSVSAWASKDSQISISYCDGFGVNGSGGIYCVMANPGTKVTSYLHVTCGPFTLPAISSDDMGACLRALKVDFAINLPLDRTINVFLLPIDAPPELKHRVFPSRLIMANRLKGTGEFTNYSIRAGDVMQPNSDPTANFFRDCLTAGMKEVRFSIAWHVIGQDWPQGEGYQLDNIKVSILR